MYMDESTFTWGRTYLEYGWMDWYIKGTLLIYGEPNWSNAASTYFVLSYLWGLGNKPSS